MRNIILIGFLFLFTNLNAQSKIEKIKIGKYYYNIYNKEYFEYEQNKMNLSFLISINNKEYFLGKYLSYNLIDKPNLLGIGKIKIDKKNKSIRCIYKNLSKNTFESFDSIVYTNKQKLDGSFRIISIIEYNNGIQKTIKSRTI